MTLTWYSAVIYSGASTRSAACAGPARSVSLGKHTERPLPYLGGVIGSLMLLAAFLVWVMLNPHDPLDARASAPTPVPSPSIIIKYEDGLPLETPLAFFIKDEQLRWREVE